MSSPDMAELTLPPYGISAGHLITARSHLVDRIVPDCEVILLPEKTLAGGTLRFGRMARTPARAPRRGGAIKGLLRRAPGVERIDDRVIFEFRTRSPQNWAHFLNNHLPVYFRLCEELGLSRDETVVVTPANTPGYIREAAAFFGVTLMATDAVLAGQAVAFEASPWGAVRTVRADWARHPAVAAAVERAIPEGGPALPRRVFLSRRGTRVLSNAAEVEGFLAGHGFQTVYPEDLSVADQFRLFREAETMVAIHSAGLAPLLYRPPDRGLRQLVELMPCGHMTDVYRVMAEQVGCAWIGVRGRIKPAYVEPAYRLGTPFTEFSLDAFEVDIASLERAFAMARHPIGESID